MKFKKCLSVIMVALMLLVLCTPQTEALFGVGDIVFDPTNEIHFIEQLQELQRQYEQMKRQVELLETRLHYFNDIEDMKGIYETVAVMLELQDDAGQLWNVANLPGDWRGNYLEDDDIKKKVLEEERDASLNHARDMINHTNRAIYNAVQAQGYVIDIENDRLVLKRLLERSDSEDANLTDAVKLGNHIAAMQIHQLMRLEYLLATSVHMQSLIYAQQVQAAKMSDVMLVEQQFAGIPEENPLKDGAGEYKEVELQ